MPSNRRVPAYQRHKHSGQAFVKLNGEFIYFGPHGTKVSRAEYDRVVGEWLASGRRPMSHAEGGAVQSLLAGRAVRDALGITGSGHQPA